MSDRTIYQLVAKRGIGTALDLLGIDPDTVLWRDCPTCGGDEYATMDDRGRETPDQCPLCSSVGRIEVNQIMVVPVGDLAILELTKTVLRPDDKRIVKVVVDGKGGQRTTRWPDTSDDIDRSDSDDGRALRIGRWVLATEPLPQLGDWATANPYAAGYNAFRADALAAWDEAIT